jgi:hypothetical protein
MAFSSKNNGLFGFKIFLKEINLSSNFYCVFLHFQKLLYVRQI